MLQRTLTLLQVAFEVWLAWGDVDYWAFVLVHFEPICSFVFERAYLFICKNYYDVFVSINHSIDQSICYLSIGPLGSDDGNSWKDAVRGTHFKPLNVTCICVTSECYLLFMWMLPLNDIFLNLWMLHAVRVNVTSEWNIFEPLNVTCYSCEMKCPLLNVTRCSCEMKYP